MRRYRWIPIALGLVALMTVAGITTVLANNTWNGFHQDTLTVSLGDNVDGQWDVILGDVSSDWSLSVLDTPVVGGSGCGMVLGTVQACNDHYGFIGWLGLAQIDIDGAGHIKSGIAKVNDTYFDTATYNDPNAKRHVFCQEIGHAAAGLDHRKKPQARSCMNDRWGLFDSRYVGPDGHDYETLDDMYGHLDGGTPPPPDDGGNGGFCDRNPEHRKCSGGPPGKANGWGKAVGHDDNGRANRFEKDLGGGLKRVTFVTWAD